MNTIDSNRDFIRNTYDDNADEWAARIRSGMNWAHEFIEKPAMSARLGNVDGSDVLLVGCGSGEETENIIRHSPASITGVDLSPRLIELAAAAYPLHRFLVSDFNDLEFSDESFDFVYSSLAFHYSDDMERTLSEVRRVLRPGGRLLFSTHHPLLWSAETLRDGVVSKRMLGYERNTETGGAVVSGDYLTPRWIDDVWFGNMPVRYYHQPMGTTVGAILKSGFSLEELVEPAPIGGTGPSLEIYRRIPPFVLFSAIAE